MSYTMHTWGEKRITDGAGMCAYVEHEQMTHEDVSHILSVADTHNIAKIAIEDINQYFNDLEDWIDQSSQQ